MVTVTGRRVAVIAPTKKTQSRTCGLITVFVPKFLFHNHGFTPITVPVVTYLACFVSAATMALTFCISVQAARELNRGDGCQLTAQPHGV
jgi:hypothetical protein